MSSRFATERVVLAQDDLVILAAEAVWLLMDGPHGERQRRTLPRPRAGEHVTAQLFGESSSGGAPNGCTRRQGSLGWITTRPLLSAAGTTMRPMVLVCFAFIVAERSRAFPPRPENCHAEASHRHDGADGNPPERHFGIPSSLCAWRAPRPGTWYPVPLCHRPRSMGPPGAHAREHRRTTPFESVVLGIPSPRISPGRRYGVGCPTAQSRIPVAHSSLN